MRLVRVSIPLGLISLGDADFEAGKNCKSLSFDRELRLARIELLEPLKDGTTHIALPLERVRELRFGLDVVVQQAPQQQKGGKR